MEIRSYLLILRFYNMKDRTALKSAAIEAGVNSKPDRAILNYSENLKTARKNRASPEIARYHFDSLRALLAVDPMASVWDNEISSTEKYHLWALIGIPDGGDCYRSWSTIPENKKRKLSRAIAAFAELSARIKRAAS